MWCGSKVGSSSRNSIVMRSPLALTRLPSLIAKPASLQQLRSPCAAGCGPGPSRRTPAARTARRTLRPAPCRERLEQRQLVRARLALRHHVGVLEHRMGAVVGPVHDVLVGPFEIEGIDQRLAHRRSLNLLAPRVDEPALRAGRRIVGQHLALDAAVADGREIVARRPDARGEFLAEQIVLGR